MPQNVIQDLRLGDSCEHSDELSGFIKCRELVDYLSNY